MPTQPPPHPTPIADKLPMSAPARNPLLNLSPNARKKRKRLSSRRDDTKYKVGRSMHSKRERERRGDQACLLREAEALIRTAYPQFIAKSKCNTFRWLLYMLQNFITRFEKVLIDLGDQPWNLAFA